LSQPSWYGDSPASIRRILSSSSSVRHSFQRSGSPSSGGASCPSNGTNFSISRSTSGPTRRSANCPTSTGGTSVALTMVALLVALTMVAPVAPSPTYHHSSVVKRILQPSLLFRNRNNNSLCSPTCTVKLTATLKAKPRSSCSNFLLRQLQFDSPYLDTHYRPAVYSHLPCTPPSSPCAPSRLSV